MRQLDNVCAMNFDAALRSYRTSLFLDDDVTRCTGLSVRSWRELIKIGAVRTVTQGRGPGRVRMCDTTTLKRAAVIAALNDTGLSLASSGRIAYFLPFHTLLYALCDPSVILFGYYAVVDPKTGLPPRVEEPKVDWFDPDKPAMADPETDWLIEIYNGRFVGVVYNANDKPIIFGDLRDEGATFLAWFPSHRQAQFGGITEELVRERLPHRFIQSVADWENPTKFLKELTLLGYKHEEHAIEGDYLRMAGEAAAHSPIFKTTVNISLALRKALRRYLGIEPPAPGSQGEAL
jgi:hypothetical protein